MEKQTPSELLAVVQQQLASLTRTVQQLQQSLQQPVVQPLHSQSNGHHPLPGIENGQAPDVLPGRRVGRKRKSIPEPEPNRLPQPKQTNRLPQPKQRRRHSMHAKVHAKQLNERQGKKKYD
ncbi:uncharacterized protein LOC129570553 [Sitodiplosis mosellana]|uniref:uncharacterized protein LOC129570553 n=1 Tax=Sitodiplosis mosellana TaxID=263140 RepID=UPI002444AB0E|nr:uncharacterized protein LOC129570553 [Sitodiplosis mosellana]